MPLTPGSKLGPYEIVAPIGAGGMGEVYRAKDARLGREVAIKVLPSHLAASPEARQRFEREARAVSSLNHPNICTLHDVGEQDGVYFLVMEHLEGETLFQRLERGPLPPDELLRVAVAIADALDRAHRQGILHRDLKPGNIMLTKSGPKLLDFGLAKETGPRALPGDLTASPTMTSPLTAAGTLVGTFQYMAPEQLDGREADARSDLFSFGATLYEMATGKRAFEGRTQASLIASIMKEEPRPITDVVPMTPPALDRLLRRLLAKDPDDRWQTARDLKAELAWIAGVGAASSGAIPTSGAFASTVTGAPLTAPRRRSSVWIAAGLGLVLGALAVATVAVLARRGRAPARVFRASLLLPKGTDLAEQDTSLAISSDGTRLAMIASGPEGARQRIWIRSLDGLDAQPLAGTEGATYPTWSPDGRSIAFFADRKLRRIPAAGGTVQQVCDADSGRGASWGKDGTIVFAPSPYGSLLEVASAGGTPVAITTVPSENVSDRNPHFLPDGRRLLFARVEGKDESARGIYLLDRSTKTASLVSKERSEGIYLDPGWLAFVRDGLLMVQPVDPTTIQPKGDAVPVTGKVSFNPYRFTGAYAIAPDGLLVYRTAGQQSKSFLTLVDPNGTTLRTIGEPANFDLRLRLSPDGRKAVANIRSADNSIAIWIYDLERGAASRLTFDTEPSGFPIWSPDGKQIAYRTGTGSINLKDAGGASDPKPIPNPDGTGLTPHAWTPDGSKIIVSRQSSKTGWDVGAIPVKGGPFEPLVEGPANENGGDLSPDGRWLAYTSDETGRREIYIVAYPRPAGKWQISSAGGEGAEWVGAGGDIAWRTQDGKHLVATIHAQGDTIEIGAPREILQNLPATATLLAPTPDGRHVLAAIPVANQETIIPLTMVTDWRGEVGRE